MHGALIFAGVLAAAYCLAVVWLFLLQRRILFRPTQARPQLAEAGVAGLQQMTVTTADGLALLAWYLPPPGDGGRVVLYLHGNAAHIGHRAYRLGPFQQLGWGVLLLEYRGYGGNPGWPSEAGLMLDARAGLATLRQLGFSDAAVLVWGESLGSGPAVRLAAEQPVGAVLLEAPFTSIADVARSRYPLVPVDWLLRDRFDSARWIAGVQAPVLVMHGARDQVVPVTMGRALHAAAVSAKELWIAAEAGHLDLVEAGAIAVAGAFVARLDGVAPATPQTAEPSA